MDYWNLKNPPPFDAVAREIGWPKNRDIPYFATDAVIGLSRKQVKEINHATREVGRLMHQALGKMAKTGIAPLKRYHKQKNDFHIVRLDFSYDGHNPPQLLEINHGNLGLMAHMLMQPFMTDYLQPGHSSYSPLREKGGKAWRAYAKLQGKRTYLSLDNDVNGFGGFLHNFLLVTAREGGGKNIVLPRRYIRKERKVTLSSANKKTSWPFMDFGTYRVAEKNLRMDMGRMLENASRDEPQLADDMMAYPAPWLSWAGNKMFTYVLWNFFPGHPNLLPASLKKSDFTRGAFARLRGYVEKPNDGYQGKGIRIVDLEKKTVVSHGTWPGKATYQAYYPLPLFKRAAPGGRNAHVLTTSFLINGEPAGICLRRATTPIINGQSSALAHYILD